MRQLVGRAAVEPSALPPAARQSLALPFVSSLPRESFFRRRDALFSRPVMFRIQLAALFIALATAHAQIQVELNFKRVQYIAHEPILATVKIANNSGRDIDLRDDNGQRWFGFEINAGESRLLAPLRSDTGEPALHVEIGQTVTRKINLTALFPVADFGTYHVRANVFFADLNKFFYST